MEYPTPFVKWPGGKRKLVPFLRGLLPPRFNTYIEPFVGGGALFFGTLPPRATLADSNQRLIRTYAAIRDDVDHVIEFLGDFSNNRVCFEFTRRCSVRMDEASDAELAAWFIYLNKTGFNGLYRVNRNNEFNVPFGKHKNPTICDEANLRACSQALRGVQLQHASFEATLVTAGEGDFVYCDPPYVPLSATSSFTSYTSDGFGIDEHRQLRDIALDLANRGVNVLISNSAAPAVLELYRSQPFHVETIAAARNIAADAASRGEVTELLITNYQPMNSRPA
jgi:DNA adenine methylase